MIERKRENCRYIFQNQEGVSLVVALLILLVLTLIGISALSTTTFETNIAGNERLYNRAFYTADAGVDYFASAGGSYILQANTYGVVDSNAAGLSASLGGDSFTVNWTRRLTDYGPPMKYEFDILSHGVSPNFPTAGRVDIEAVVEVVDTAPSLGYPGGS